MRLNPFYRQQTNKKDQEIYSNMIVAHRAYIRNQLMKCQNTNRASICKSSSTLKQNKQKQFFNTVLHKYSKTYGKLTKDQLLDVPAKDFIDLCFKLSQISISKRTKGNKSLEEINPCKKSHKQVKLNRQKTKQKKPSKNQQSYLSTYSRQANTQKLTQLQVNMNKLIPKLLRLGVISSKQFLKVFARKLQEIRSLQNILQQQQLQQQFCLLRQHQSIANLLVHQFKKYQKYTFDRASEILPLIQSNLSRLTLVDQHLLKNQQTSYLSIDTLKQKIQLSRVESFRQIKASLQSLIDKIAESYEILSQQQITIKDIKSFSIIYKESTRSFFNLINRQLVKIYHQPLRDLQMQYQRHDNRPAQLQKTANSQYLKLYQDFIICQQCLQKSCKGLIEVLKTKDFPSLPQGIQNPFQGFQNKSKFSIFS